MSELPEFNFDDYDRSGSTDSEISEADVMRAKLQHTIGLAGTAAAMAEFLLVNSEAFEMFLSSCEIGEDEDLRTAARNEVEHARVDFGGMRDSASVLLALTSTFGPDFRMI